MTAQGSGNFDFNASLGRSGVIFSVTASAFKKLALNQLIIHEISEYARNENSQRHFFSLHLAET